MHPQSLSVLHPGAVFHGRYRVERCIKAGGMGAVYGVVDETTASARALKVMLPSLVADRDHRARFALEARVTGGIESDHLVRVSDAGIDEPSGMPFLVMDLLRGEELAQLLERRRALSAGEVVLYLHQAALALDKTHAGGIVHRDLKPENLFLTHRDDGSPCMKILDFGIAKVVLQNQAAEATRAMGTPLYMSPEQIRGVGTIGPRADLYALAQIAYTCLVGEPYWAEESKSSETLFPLLAQIVAGAVEPASVRARRRTGVALPASLDAWYFKAAAPAPEARFDRATEQVLALAQASGIASPTPSLSAAVPVVTGAVAPPGAMAYAPAPGPARLASSTVPLEPPFSAAVPPRADSGPTPAAVTASVVPARPVASPAATGGSARGAARVVAAVVLMGAGGLAAALLFGRSLMGTTTAPSAPASASPAASPAAPRPPEPAPAAVASTIATTAANDAGTSPEAVLQAPAEPSVSVPRGPRAGAPGKAYGKPLPPPAPSPTGPRHEGIF